MSVSQVAWGWCQGEAWDPPARCLERARRSQSRCAIVGAIAASAGRRWTRAPRDAIWAAGGNFIGSGICRELVTNVFSHDDDARPLPLHRCTSDRQSNHLLSALAALAATSFTNSTASSPCFITTSCMTTAFADAA